MHKFIKLVGTSPDTMYWLCWVNKQLLVGCPGFISILLAL